MVDVRVADEATPERWDDLVERSQQGTPFHRAAAMETIAEHSGTTLYPLVGYKGEEPVGLFPLYERSVGPVTVLFSPPPGLGFGYQGPLLVNVQKLKHRKAEKRNRRFVDGCVALLETELSPNYVHVRNEPRYGDTRPFTWNGFETSPLYTYVLDLTAGEETLVEQFSRSVRRKLRDDYDDRYDIEEGGRAALERIVEQSRSRYEEQGKEYPVTTAFVLDLWQTLPEGTVRPYVCTVDGSYEGGIVTLEFGGTVHRWLGGVTPDTDVPVNDLVDSRIIRDAIDRGQTRYDLLGANDRRISQYKAKFAPDLTTYHEMERGSVPIRLASTLYRRVARPMFGEVKTRLPDPLRPGDSG